MIPSRLLVAFLVLAATAYPQTLVEVAKRKLKDKTVLLRGFPKGKKLKYDAQGYPIALKSGAWTLDGFIHVDWIEEKRGEVRISGQRLLALYDAKSKKMELSKYKDTASLRIPVSAGQNASDVIKRIFILEPERIVDNVPEYWRSFLTDGVKTLTASNKTPIDQRPCEPPEDGVYKLCKGMKAPEPTFRPEPEFPNWLREHNISGSVSVTALVDAKGNVKKPEITKPCGASLDESAIAAVSSWKFKPAVKDGTPVPVRVTIDVEFQSY